MDLDAALDFVRGHSRAVLVTTRDDGTPQTSPVTVAVAASGTGTAHHVEISTRETAAKTRNLRKRPRASLLVLSDGFFGPWVQLDGEAEIVSLPEALEPLVDQYRRLAGEHPDWDDYRRAMVEERRVLVRLRVTRAGPDVSG